MQFSGQICTSEQQSKRLIEMGINRDSADMFYSYDYAAGEITELNVLYNPSQMKYDDIPAWSLNRLLEILPTRLIKNNYTFNSKYKDIPTCQFYLSIWPYYRKQVTYELYLEGEPFYLWRSNKDNLFDNIIDCIEWLLKEHTNQ